ncbi:hypothetical protein QFC24_006997 [Naganishia onofrii]|uniref:Uncharacterized protein n=1 Tax=Naganishia onofrii TaxID=1851511 RepID=A0ACC2WV26_9TREE|nr:hypothetical protein QFC24_006997 [Naganishia onofrii]
MTLSASLRSGFSSIFNRGSSQHSVQPLPASSLEGTTDVGPGDTSSICSSSNNFSTTTLRGDDEDDALLEERLTTKGSASVGGGHYEDHSPGSNPPDPMKLELERLKDQEQKARHAKTEFRKDDGKKFSRINLRKVVTGKVKRVFRSTEHVLDKRLAKMTDSEFAELLDSLPYG